MRLRAGLDTGSALEVWGISVRAAVTSVRRESRAPRVSIHAAATKPFASTYFRRLQVALTTKLRRISDLPWHVRVSANLIRWQGRLLRIPLVVEYNRL